MDPERRFTWLPDTASLRPSRPWSLRRNLWDYGHGMGWFNGLVLLGKLWPGKPWVFTIKIWGVPVKFPRENQSIEWWENWNRKASPIFLMVWWSKPMGFRWFSQLNQSNDMVSLGILFWLVLTGTIDFLWFSVFGNFIIPTDELIFFRGVGWNHQPVFQFTTYMFCLIMLIQKRSAIMMRCCLHRRIPI